MPSTCSQTVNMIHSKLIVAVNKLSFVLLTATIMLYQGIKKGHHDIIRPSTTQEGQIYRVTTVLAEIFRG